MAPPELEIRDLVHFYQDKKVLEIPSLQIQTGECLIIFGPNGAGKSTLLRIASLLEKPDHGQIFYGGTKVTSENELALRRRNVLLLERPLFFQGRVKENLLYGLKIRELKPKEQAKRLDEISELFHLKPFLDRYPQELSSGEKQRVNLARAFIIKPDLLFLDEPFSSLDPSLKEEILAEFQIIRRKIGQTTLFVTHNREEASYLADRMIVLIEGKIAQVGKPEEILDKPASAEIARLMGQKTLVEGLVVGQENGLLKIAAAGQIIHALGTSERGEKVKVIFRPEEVILASKKPETSIRNWFYGSVMEIKPLDKVILVSLDCGFKLKVYLTKPALEELGVVRGKSFWAGVKASSLSAKTFKGNVEGGKSESKNWKESQDDSL